MENNTKRRTRERTILEINESDFEEKVLDCERPVLVSFLTKWSHPCQILEPVLDKVADQCKGRAKIFKVDADDNPDLGLWYGIHFIPTLLIFTNGSVVGKIVGTATKQAILSKLNS